MDIKNPELQAMRQQRDRAMSDVPEAEGGPFVPIQEAADLARVSRSNVYHWMRTGEVRRRDWGEGRGSVYASLADLARKVPAAFPSKAEPAPAQRPRKVKRAGRSARKRRAA